MTPRMYFVLVLRGMGIWRLVYSLEYFTSAWNIHEKFYTLPYDTAASFVNLGMVNLLVGAVLLFGASAIGALVVPAIRPKQPDVNDATDA